MRRILASVLLIMPILAHAQPYTPIPLVTQGQVWTVPQWNETWTTLNSLFLNPVLSGLGNGTVTATGATTAQSLSNITARIYAVEDFGAVGNGTTDDSGALASCITAAAANHGVCALANEQYYIASSLTIPPYAALKGGTDPGQDGSSPPWNANVLRPMIIEGGGVTINVAGELSNAAIVRANINLNPMSAQNVISNTAAYNGTGITLTGPAVVEHDVIIGMAQAITTNGQANWRIRHIRGDNTAGLMITGMHDFSWADDVEWMPMLNPQICCAQLTGTVTGAANNGSGLVRLSLASTTQFVTGNQMVVYGVGGVPGANGRWIITVIDGTHIDLVGSSFAGSYTSGGSVAVDADNRSGKAFSVDTSESPLLTQISQLGYDGGLYFGTGATWTNVVGYSADNGNFPDPGENAIYVDSNANSNHVQINYIGTWNPITINTTSSGPTVISGGSIYSNRNSAGNQTYPTSPAGGVNVLQGELVLSDVDCQGINFNVTSSGTLFLSNANCNGATWTAGANFANVYMTNTLFGDVSGASVRGPQVHLQVPTGGTSWLDGFDVTNTAVQSNLPTTINVGTQSTANLLTISGSNPGGDQGGQIMMTTTYPGATSPNKFLGISATGDFYLNNSLFSASLFRLSEAGDVWFSGALPVTIHAYGDVASGAGNAWLLQASGAQSGGTNLAGGNLTLASGKATGNGTSAVIIQAAGGGSSGSGASQPSTVASFAKSAIALTTSALSMNSTAGVTCSGTPTSSFASVNGIVTHC